MQEKTFAVQEKTMQTTKVLALKCFVLNADYVWILDNQFNIL